MSTRGLPEQIGDLPRIGRPATSALSEQGITSLDQVAAKSRRELLELHGVGPKAVQILGEALEASGRGFAADSEADQKLGQ